MKKYGFKILMFISIILLFSSLAYATNDNITIEILSEAEINVDEKTVDEINVDKIKSDDISKSNAPSIQSTDLTKYYQSTSQFTAKFFDANNAPLKNTQVGVIINGVNSPRTTDSQGSITVTINLNPGIYTIKLTNPVTSYSVNNQITVLPTLVASDITKYFQNGTQYTVKVLNKQGTPIPNVNVNMNINGALYTRTTASNGIATLSINLDPGTYTITTTHPDGLQMSNTVKVLSTVIGEDVAKFSAETKSYNVKILNGQGNPISSLSVNLNINGVIYQRVTNANGIASLAINLNPGQYIITATANGLNQANDVNVYKSVSEDLTGLLITPITKNIQKGGTYEVKLTQKNGLPLANKQLKITLNPGNKINYITTNSQGIASLTINENPGSYNILINYLSFSASRSLTVTSANNGANTLLTPLTSALWSGQTFSVKLTNKNTNAVLANEQVSFYFTNGAEQFATTNSQGIASITINKNPGVYGISVNYAGTTTGTYKPTSIYKIFYVGNSFSDLSYTPNVYPDTTSLSNYIDDTILLEYYNMADFTSRNSKHVNVLAGLLTVYNDPLEDVISINNYVSDLDYTYYFGSRDTALSSILSFEGNCVDQTAVFVALSRLANFPTRYIEGDKIGGGDGHAWGQIKVDNIWICVDNSVLQNIQVIGGVTYYTNSAGGKELGNKKYLYDQFTISTYIISWAGSRQIYNT